MYTDKIVGSDYRQAEHLSHEFQRHSKCGKLCNYVPIGRGVSNRLLPFPYRDKDPSTLVFDQIDIDYVFEQHPLLRKYITKYQVDDLANLRPGDVRGKKIGMFNPLTAMTLITPELFNIIPEKVAIEIEAGDTLKFSEAPTKDTSLTMYWIVDGANTPGFSAPATRWSIFARMRSILD